MRMEQVLNLIKNNIRLGVEFQLPLSREVRQDPRDLLSSWQLCFVGL